MSIIKNEIPILEYDPDPLAVIMLMQAPVGAPAAAQILDWLIAYGVREIVSCGSCGVRSGVRYYIRLTPSRTRNTTMSATGAKVPRPTRWNFASRQFSKYNGDRWRLSTPRRTGGMYADSSRRAYSEFRGIQNKPSARIPFSYSADIM